MHIKRLRTQSNHPSRLLPPINRQTNEGGVIDDDVLLGDEVEGDENTFAMGGPAGMVEEDSVGIRELVIASELGASRLFVPKGLPRPKGARTGTRSSLLYAETLYLLVRSSVIPPFAEASSGILRHPSRRDLRFSHSSRRGWKTRSPVSCDLSTSLVSMDTMHPRAFSLPPPPQRRRNRSCSNLLSLDHH